MPASPRSVSTACSMRPLGRPRRRGVEEPDCRDIVVAPNRLAEPRPRSRGVPEKHDAGPGGSASAMDSRCCDLLVTLAYASGSPHETGGDGGAGDANGYRSEEHTS